MEQVCHYPLHFPETTAGQNVEWKFGFITYISVIFLCLCLGVAWGFLFFQRKKNGLVVLPCLCLSIAHNCASVTDNNASDILGNCPW